MNDAITLIREALGRANLGAPEIERLYAELPERGYRTGPESDVATALRLAYRDALRPAHEHLTCRALSGEHRLSVGKDGRYVARRGESLDLVSVRVDVIDSILETRLSCDLFELWEASGGSIHRDGDTDAFSRFIFSEVARRCSATIAAATCEHMGETER